jgi:hypothetical protein
MHLNKDHNDKEPRSTNTSASMLAMHHRRYTQDLECVVGSIQHTADSICNLHTHDDYGFRSATTTDYILNLGVLFNLNFNYSLQSWLEWRLWSIIRLDNQ